MTEPIDLITGRRRTAGRSPSRCDEMGLPYRLHLVDISGGRAVRAGLPRDRAEQPDAGDRRSDGPDGAPISVFEFGAILQYLRTARPGSSTGPSERERVEIEQWLMWQMGGVGPMAGQAHHFLKYAPAMEPPNDLPYAKDRYRNEVAAALRRSRPAAGGSGLRGGAVFDRGHGDLAWACLWEGQQQDIANFPRMKAWLDRVGARPAVKAGRAVEDGRRSNVADEKKSHAILFGKRPVD